ncbi:EAL domain-containing protein [Actinoplanes sp. Pm04-4]|uniref:EAL domain-containing protein n=1 Tax=Paractinoplanes pyxinae TaxID=2997416 RepID=A0ABT4B8B6_9ACTN|nr:EAL domain-containing protein [Actinoplanes pyxinae]MCY1142745.1 EAL domain-containing protein [Actinoplanes pyxinae]
MNLDDILALAESQPATALEVARARRFARAVLSEHDAALAENREIIVDAEVVDPLAAGLDEATRIARAAQLAKLGTITWTVGRGQPRRLTDVSWSDEMAMIFGYAPGTIELTSDALLKIVHPADAAAFRAAVEAAWEHRRPGEVTFRVIRQDRTVCYVRCDIEVLTDAGEPSGVIATGEDVTAQELARQERVRVATRNEMLCADRAAQDHVTGLPSRAWFTDEVDRARRTTDGALVVVATEPAVRLPGDFTDADRDRLAARTAHLLEQIAGPGVTCGLVGPGLWGMLVTGPDRPGETPEALAERIADTLRHHLFPTGSKSIRLNTWAGLVHFGAGVPETGFDLLVDGEYAVREARRSGHVVHALDHPVRNTERTARCRERVLRAVSANRFALYTQPLLDLGLNKVTRHEILLRVRSDTGEPTAPWAFLDIAERVGEILAVDKWVIDHALEAVSRGTQTSHYQLNVSGRSLADPGLLAFVHEAIRRHEVDPARLTFEITETALIENHNAALDFATGIRRIGCHLALDDYGTGFAPLNYLRHFPVDLVKIDGTFIVDLCRSPTDQALVSQLVTLCHTLGIRVAAEYVEDEPTLDLLRGYGVDFAQGFRCGRPVPIGASLAAPESVELELRLPARAGEDQSVTRTVVG